jgi:hypothetical protein
MSKFALSFLVGLISFGSLSQAVDSAQAITPDTSFIKESYYIPYRTETAWTLLDLNSNSLNLNYSFDAFCPGESEDVTFYIFRKGDKYGALFDSGDTLLGFEYDSIVPFEYDFITLKEGNWKYHNWDGAIDMNADSLFIDDGHIYTYRNGKMGLMLSDKTIAPAEYESIRQWGCVQLQQTRDKVFLAHNGSHYSLLDLDGNSLIDEPIEKIDCFEFSIVKFYSDRWKYYSIALDKIIDPKGSDIVFYNATDYKIYNNARTRSTLYINSENAQYSGSYDDYFLFSKNHLAVRENGKIGLIDRKTKALVLAPQFDKLENIDGTLLKYFKGDSCGLMNISGEIYFDAEYANVIKTSNPDRFIVLNQNKTGLVNLKGEIIVPVKYDYIILDNDVLILQKNKRYGMANHDGKIIVPLRYVHYEKHPSPYLEVPVRTNYIFEKGRRDFYLANSKGFVTQQGFSHFNFGNGVVKLYAGQNLIVIILNNEGGILESQTYSNVSAFTVKKDDYNYPYTYKTWPASYLEENQLNGKYGLRYYSKTGMGVPPIYTHIQLTTFGDYYGEMETAAKKFEIAEGLDIDLSSIYDGMYLSTGQNWNTSTLMTEVVCLVGGTNNSDLCAIIQLDGSSNFESNVSDNPLSQQELKESPIRYTDKINDNLKRFYIGGTVEVCPIDSAEISLFHYFEYLNSLGAFSMPKNLVSTIMDPKLGVRFVGSVTRISEYGAMPNKELRQDFWPPKTYLEFDVLPGTDYFREQKISDPTFIEISEYETEKEVPFYSKKKLINTRSISGSDGYFVETMEKGRRREKIHVDYPKFEFFPSETRLSYNAGRVIGFKDSVYSLSTPYKTIIKDAYYIKYLEEEMFAILNNEGWYIIDRNGKRRDIKHYTSLSKFSNGQIGVVQDQLNLIVDKAGAVVAKGSGQIKYFKDDKFIIGETPNVILYDSKSHIEDTLQKKEKYLGKEFIYTSLGDGKYSIRTFGSRDEVVLKGKPKLINNYIYCSHKKSYYIVNQGLQVTKYKKVSSTDQVSPSIAIFRRKKDIYYFDESGEEIYVSKKDVRQFAQGENVIILDGDSTYTLSTKGEILEYNERAPIVNKTVEKSSYSIAFENGKYGVMLDKEYVIPAAYRSISAINSKEYLVPKDLYKTLYTTEMEKISTMNYDKVWLLNGNGILLLAGDQYYYFDRLNEQIIDVGVMDE